MLLVKMFFVKKQCKYVFLILYFIKVTVTNPQNSNKRNINDNQYHLYIDMDYDPVLV